MRLIEKSVDMPEQVDRPHPQLQDIRPMVVASTLHKLLERPLADPLKEYYNLHLDPSQTGFISGMRTGKTHMKLIKKTDLNQIRPLYSSTTLEKLLIQWIKLTCSR